MGGYLVPVFSEGDPKPWIAWMEEFHVKQNMTDLEKMAFATGFIDDEAFSWLQWRQSTRPLMCWEEMKNGLLLQFGNQNDLDLIKPKSIYEEFAAMEKRLEAIIYRHFSTQKDEGSKEENQLFREKELSPTKDSLLEIEAHNKSIPRQISLKASTQMLDSDTDGATVHLLKHEPSVKPKTDVGALYAQLKELQKKNTDMEESNKQLSSKLQTKEVENESLETRLKLLEQNTVPSLRKALKEVAMEKDAAVILREDLSSQVRTLKKRVKDAEEEQHRAEEDAASLRAKLNLVQQQALSTFQDQVASLEKELAVLRLDLKKESMLRQQEQERLAQEQTLLASLMPKKQELEQKIAVLPSGASESSALGEKLVSMEDNEKLEKQLHDMAVVIESLESSRQKLLMEIDDRTSEIERFFEENVNLFASYQESSVSKQWENQVKECLDEIVVVRGAVDKLRTVFSRVSSDVQANESHGVDSLSLKREVVKEQSRAEALSAQILQLSALLQQITQAYNGFLSVYKPVVRNTESSLINLEQDGLVTIAQ